MQVTTKSGGQPCARTFEAHDLLRLSALPAAHDAPAWLPSAFAEAAFAVVRRASAPAGFIAVGFRGAQRSQRYGTFAAREAVLSVYAPEDLVDRPPNPERRGLKAFTALREIRARQCLDALVWGPTGSVGFELATTYPSATATSDLDLLIRVPAPLDREHARALRERLSSIEREYGLRVDTQLETPAGGVALGEWAQDKPRVLARSATGPRLVHDPWAVEANR